MRRRSCAAIPLALVACRVAPLAADGPLSAAPRTLALSLSDLPGFTIREEIAPEVTGSAGGDPFGRRGSYSATFTLAANPEIPPVTSSINIYDGIDQARAAFGSWRSLVPRQYRPTPLSIGLNEQDSAAYARENDGTLLVGYRVRNVLGSLRAPAADAERLVRLLLARSAKA